MAPTDVSDVSGDGLRAWAGVHGAKYTRILLDRGGTPDQPMLTFTGRGTLADQRTAAADRVELLRQAGFTVVRVKIEASPRNPDVPVDTGEPGRYFEHHVKLVLADAGEADRVRAAVAGHGAHLSRNARRGPPCGRHERFVTQRCHGVGRVEAARRLALLLVALRGHEVVETEQEYVMVDDHPTLDAGWIDGGGLEGGWSDGGWLEGGRPDGGWLDGARLSGDRVDGGWLDGGRLCEGRLDG